VSQVTAEKTLSRYAPEGQGAIQIRISVAEGYLRRDSLGLPAEFEIPSSGPLWTVFELSLRDLPPILAGKSILSTGTFAPRFIP